MSSRADLSAHLIAALGSDWDYIVPGSEEALTKGRLPAFSVSFAGMVRHGAGWRERLAVTIFSDYAAEKDTDDQLIGEIEQVLAAIERSPAHLAESVTPPEEELLGSWGYLTSDVAVRAL